MKARGGITERHCKGYALTLFRREASLGIFPKWRCSSVASNEKVSDSQGKKPS